MAPTNSQPDYTAIRQKNLQRLSQWGFSVSSSLPHGPRDDSAALRPIEQIAKRLWALDALFLYVSVPGKTMPTKTIRESVARNGLSDHLTDEENAILNTRWRWLARRNQVHSIGWRLENMLSLAWILGFDVPPSTQGEMLDGEPLQRMICEFIGDLDQDFGNWVNSRSPQSEVDVVDKEDLFYCAHNAVRSAQLGEDTVPDTFHPIVNGGVVHERRHALTWAVSPGVHWDETDLST